MTKLQQIKIGFKGYSKASKLIFTRKFAKFLLFPLALNIIIFWLGTDFITNFAKDSQKDFLELINLEGATFWGVNFLNSLVGGLVSIIIYILFLIIFLYITGTVIIIILSPVFSAISENTEELITKSDISYPFDFKQLMKDIFRGLRLALRNFIYQTLILILIFAISFIPVIGWFGGFFMFIATSYFFGFSFMDFVNERRKRNLKQSVKYMRKYKWVAMANGSIFALSLAIPFCGVSISAFVAIISVIAGTVSMIEIEKQENNEIA